MSFTRIAPRLRPVWSSLNTTTRTFTTTPKTLSEEWPQRTPLGLYYESCLNMPSPLPFEKKFEQPTTTTAPKVQPAEKEKAVAEKEPAPATATEKKPTLEKKALEPAKAKEEPIDEKKKHRGRPNKKSKPGRKASSENNASPPLSPEPPVPNNHNTTADPESSSSRPESSPPPPPPQTPQEKARIIFGSRLLGPADQADRLALKKEHSTNIAGVIVPPHPEEPDNCCMSGCVNCVWERYREEMEEYAAAKAEAALRLNENEKFVDADGRVSETSLEARDIKGAVPGDTNKIAKDLWDDRLYENVPVGIREFMKQEKRLKERHKREGTFGG